MTFYNSETSLRVRALELAVDVARQDLGVTADEITEVAAKFSAFILDGTTEAKDEGTVTAGPFSAATGTRVAGPFTYKDNTSIPSIAEDIRALLQELVKGIRRD